MNTKDLTVSLLRYRMERSGALQGFTKGEAALMAEQRLKNEGLLGFFGKVKMAATPEGAIVGIVETFWRSLIQQILANPSMVRLPENDPARQVMTARFRKNAVHHIEAHRTKFYRGTDDHPEELTDYVFYRIGTEIRQIHKIEPEEMGLDRETIRHMVDECNGYFRAHIGDLR